MDLQIIDIFGIGIGLRYLNKEEYQTRFGAIVTVVIAALVSIQVVYVGLELIQKKNPDVIFAERFVTSPERFDIKRDTFNFAFGAQFPGNFSHFIDDSIYSVTAEQVSMHKKFNQTSGEFYQDWQTLPIGIHPCTSKDFAVKQSLEYFNTLAGVDSMYCLDYDSQDLFIEGNFDQEAMCIDKPNCRPIDEIKSILTNSFVAHYTNDIIINPKDYNPFSVISRDMYWSANPFYPKDAYLYYRNNYVETDTGVFFEQSSYEKQPSLSYLNEQIIFGESDYYFAMYIRFEKAKESIYHRKYKKLDSFLAEIGGIAKALVILGFIICWPVNQLKLHQQLSNSLFSFKKDGVINENDKNQRMDGQAIVKMIQEQQQQTQIVQSQFQKNLQTPFSQRLINKDSNFKPTSTTKIPQYESHQESSLSQRDILTAPPSKGRFFASPVLENIMKVNENNLIIEDENTPKTRLSNAKQSDAFINLGIQSVNNSTNQQLVSGSGFNLLKMIKTTKQLKQNSLQSKPEQKDSQPLPKQNIQFKRSKSAIDVKNLFNQNKKKNEEDESLQLSWTDYIKYYVWPWGQFAKKKKQIDYSVERIYQHLDMLYIVQKLLELEKLKSVLLSEDQQKLIQFFPKPQIDVDEIDSEKKERENNLKSKKTIQVKRSSQRHKSVVNLLNDSLKNEKDRAKEAFQALKNIIKKQHLTDVDRKIIEMLDGSILENIENNAEYLQELEEQDEIQCDQIIYENKQEQYDDNYYFSSNHKDIQFHLDKNQNLQHQQNGNIIQQKNEDETSSDGSVDQPPNNERNVDDRPNNPIQSITQHKSINSQTVGHQTQNNQSVLLSFNKLSKQQNPSTKNSSKNVNEINS